MTKPSTNRSSVFVGGSIGETYESCVFSMILQ